MLLLKVIYSYIVAINEICERDKRITNQWLLSKPWPVMAVVGLYLITVLKLGPKFMEKRKPYKVEGAVKIYNIVQIMLNSVIFYECVKYIYQKNDYSWTCQKYDLSDRSPETLNLVRPTVLYYVSKYLDFLDTIFFLMRKKFNQVTFLHVYHHAGMVLGVYIYCVLFFGSHFTLVGVFNSFIHVCMYTYYMVAVFKPNINLKPWKLLVTRLQLLQFVLISFFCGLPLLNNWCNLSTAWLLIAFVQNTFMIALFSNFYYNTYMAKGSKKKNITE